MFGSNSRLPFQQVNHDKTKRLGYNLGFNKGTFATSFDRKEYFETHIRPQNKRDFQPGVIANVHKKNQATFIQHDKMKRQDFEEKVQGYMDDMNKAERDER